MGSGRIGSGMGVEWDWAPGGGSEYARIGSNRCVVGSGRELRVGRGGQGEWAEIEGGR